MLRGRIKSLDGLRGLACLPIVLVHYYGAADAINGAGVRELPFAGILGPLYEYGYIFVYVFFWLSGFLCESRYKDNIKQLSIFSFIKKRMKKLYPMAFVSITLGIVISFMDQVITGGMCVQKPIKLWYIFLSYTFQQIGWVEQSWMMPYGSGGWFLCVLLLCYVLFWVINNLFDQNKYYFYVTIMFFIGWAAYSGNKEIPFFNVWNGSGYCGFFGGVLLYELFYGDFCENTQRIKSIFNNWLFSAGLLCILLGAVVLGGCSPVMVLVLYSPIMILYSLEVRWTKTLLELKGIQLLGRLSMSIYMSHAHVINLISIILVYSRFPSSYRDSYFFFMVIISCIIIGIIYYGLIEKRFVRLWNTYISKD